MHWCSCACALWRHYTLCTSHSTPYLTGNTDDTVFLSSILYGREPGGCECGVGWSGEGCSTCAPYPGCANGACSQPWECTCQVKKSSVLRTRIWFQRRSGYGSGPSTFYQCGSGSGSRSKVLMTKNWKKFTAEIKFIFFDQKLQFTYP